MMVSRLGDGFEGRVALGQDPKQSLENGAHNEWASRGPHHSPQLTAAEHNDGRHAAERLLTCRSFVVLIVTLYMFEIRL